VARPFFRYKVWIACTSSLAAGLAIAWMLPLVGTGLTAGNTAPATSDEKAALPTRDVLGAIPAPRSQAAADRAVARWTERVRLQEQDEGAWANLGDALMQKARETADATYYGHAERAYNKALVLNPKNVAAVAGVAWVFGGRHEFEESVRWAEKVLALEPDNTAALGLLGDAAVEMGDYNSAFEHYQKMLNLRPDLSSYSRGAHLLYQTGDVRKASWLMGKAIESGAPYAENTAWCRAQLALLYFGNGNLVGAEQVLDEAKAGAANNYHVLAALGKVKAAREDFAGAIECYRKAAEIAPRHEVLVALGELYQLTGKEEKAAEHFELVEKVHQLNKANGVRGDAQLALFYADRDRNLAEALKMAEEEYKTRKNVHVADALAWCYYKNGRYEDAKRLAQKALMKKTPESLFHFHAGMIHAKLGDRVSAQQELYEALNLNPHFSPVYAKTAVAMLAELGSKPPASNP
jgi:tetratricopeptide (TPR) repeat protein